MTTAPVPRPVGVFWARSALKGDAPLCVDPAHAVYERCLITGGTEAQRKSATVYACAVCWPAPAQGPQAGPGAPGAIR